MNAKFNLTQEQMADALRLKKIYEAQKAENKSLTQESLASACGWKTQSAVGQYLNGAVPLNLDALIKFSLALNVPVTSISPTLGEKIIAASQLLNAEKVGMSQEALRVAKAFDQLAKPAQKAAVLGQLVAFGALDEQSNK